MEYFSTRDKSVSLSAAEAVKMGLSRDGGLLTPKTIPQIDRAFLESLMSMDYAHRAAKVMALYLTDYTEEELLTSENIFEADAFVSLTGRDEENLLMALTAQRAGVPKVLAKMTRPNYMDLVRDMRVGSIVSPKDIVANQITRYVRALANSEGSAVESLYKMLGGAVEALEFTATARSRAVLNKPLRALSLKDGVLVAAIARGSEIIIPGGTSIIQEGDHVVVVTNAHTFDDLGDILA